jgi:dUTP pyrophosphatase
MCLEYCLIRKGKEPEYAHEGDAGLDLFFNPAVDASIVINPGECAILETGYKFRFSSQYCIEIKNRSSMAAKRSLLVGACIVDSCYSGEVYVNLHNVGKLPQEIKVGDKIAQAILYPVAPQWLIKKKNEKDLYVGFLSERGEGAFGSTE